MPNHGNFTLIKNLTVNSGTPYSLDLMQRLAQIAEILRNKCKHEQIEIAKETPEVLRKPPINSNSAIAKALAELRACQ